MPLRSRPVHRVDDTLEQLRIAAARARHGVAATDCNVADSIRPDMRELRLAVAGMAERADARLRRVTVALIGLLIADLFTVGIVLVK